MESKTPLTPEARGRILDLKASIQKEKANIGSLDFTGQVWMAEQIKEWKREIKALQSGKVQPLQSL